MDADVLKSFRLYQQRKAAQEKAEYDDYNKILAELFQEAQEEEKESEAAYDKVYCLPNGTLKNKRGKTKREDAETEANRIAGLRRRQISQMASEGLPICESGWNEEMLKDIHRALMGEMYDWAGEYRTVDVGIAFDNCKYMSTKEMRSTLKETFNLINSNNCFRGMERGAKIKNLALVFGNLKNAQPFRDGNTRTAMVFTQLLAGASGETVDFNYFAKDVDKNGKEGEKLEGFRLAQVAARDNNYHYLTLCFSQMVYPVEERPELAMPRVKIGKQGDLLTTLKEMTGEIVAHQKEHSDGQVKRIIPKHEKALPFNSRFAVGIEKEVQADIIDNNNKVEQIADFIRDR